MNRAQLLLIAILCAVSLRKFVGAGKVEQGHRDSHHEKDFLQRTKRYAIGRVPLSYLSVQPSGIRKESGTGYTIDKRYRSNALNTNPAASHFRELQERQTRRPTSPGDDYLSPAQLQAYKNMLQYYGNGDGENADVDGFSLGDAASALESDSMPLADGDLQSLSLLLDAYGRQRKSALPLRDYYAPPVQYFNRDDVNQMGKRETGKRSKGQLGQEQPMSFENSLGDSYPVFLNQKRSKRIGDPSKGTSSVRIKKETDRAVEASLDKIFGDHSQREDEKQQRSTSIPTTAISSSDQIPAPSNTQTKSKKAIDWSDYFGIDKRQDKHSEAISSSPSDTTNHLDAEQEHKTAHNPEKSDNGKTTTSGSSSVGSVPAVAPDQKADKLKDKKDKDRQENDTEDKADRSWILKEFYKNLAMATNVKRKRESPNTGTGTMKDLDKLEKIERKMEEAGDQIIWDTLKYTGAHRDAELSPEELTQVKNEIIQKLAAAYSLEKIREAIEEFRQQLAQLKDKQQYY